MIRYNVSFIHNRNQSHPAVSPIQLRPPVARKLSSKPCTTALMILFRSMSLTTTGDVRNAVFAVVSNCKTSPFPAVSWSAEIMNIHENYMILHRLQRFKYDLISSVSACNRFAVIIYVGLRLFKFCTVALPGLFWPPDT